MDGQLRLSTPADIPQMLVIAGEAKAFMKACGVDQWQNGYPDETVLLDDIARGCGYVFEVDGKVRAFAAVVFDGEPDYAHIYSGAWGKQTPYACIHRVAVASSARGTGTGSRLVREAEALIRSRGFSCVRIDTHRDNAAMRRMLERNGYELRGVIRLSSGAEAGTERIALEKFL